MLVTLAGAIVAALAALAIPLPTAWHAASWLFYLSLSVTLAYAVIQLGAAGLFLGSLDVYKTALRQAYVAIVVSLVLLAASTIQLAVISALDLWDTFWVNDGLVMLPYLVGGFLAYIGTRRLARLIDARTIVARATIALPAIVILCLLTIPLPHAPVPTPEAAFDVTIILVTWTTLMYLAAGFIAWSAQRRIGAFYKSTTSWLAGGLLASAVALGIATLHALATAETQDLPTLVVDTIGLISSLFYLRAGYAMTKTKQGLVTSLLGLFQAKTEAPPPVATPTELVISTAILASNPQNIDPMLDRFRTMTATLGPDQTSRPGYNQTFIDIYLQLEAYLTTKEPLRTFTVEDLRSRLTPELRQAITEREQLLKQKEGTVPVLQ